MGESKQAVMIWQNEVPAGSTEQQTTAMKPLRTKAQDPSVLSSLIPLFIPCDSIVLKSLKENSTFSWQDLKTTCQVLLVLTLSIFGPLELISGHGRRDHCSFRWPGPTYGRACIDVFGYTA